MRVSVVLHLCQHLDVFTKKFSHYNKYGVISHCGFNLHFSNVFPDSSDGKESACYAGDAGSVPELGRKWQPTSVLLLGELHGQRSLAGYSPWGGKDSDMTE